jgi:osmotically-inducible protein OsmY
MGRMKTLHILLLTVPLVVPAGCKKANASPSPEPAAAAPGSPMPADETPVDHIITERVKLALQQERGLDKELGLVGIATRQGVVTLTGTVSSQAVRDRFTIVTKAVGSVVRVDNQLTFK